MTFLPRLDRNALPPDVAAAVPAEDGSHLAELLARGETLLTLWRGAALVGFACFGRDHDGWLTVYRSRAMDGAGMVARAAMIGLFGAAQVAGARGVRVHTSQVRAMARMMGAPAFAEGIDGDGLPMGFFHA